MTNLETTERFLPMEPIPRAIASLFAACVNRSCVDLDADPRPVRECARLPVEKKDRADATAAPAAPSAPDPQVAVLLDQVKALETVARNLLAAAGSRMSAAEFAAARASLGWPPAETANTRASSRSVADNVGARSPSIERSPPPVRISLPAEARREGHRRDEPHCGSTIKKFCLSDRKRGRINMIIGKRGTGKTTLVNDILASIDNDWDVVVAMSPHPDSRRALAKIFPESCIHDSYDEEVINRILSTTRNLRSEGIDTRVLLILDDGCMANPRVLKSTTMRDLYMNGRHLGIEVYSVIQYALDMPKCLRSQVDYVFAFREVSESPIRTLYTTFFSNIKSYGDFSAILEACTQDHGCMVLDSTVQGTLANNYGIHWYRASIREPTALLGSRAQWLLHHMFYRPPPDHITAALDDPIPGLRRANLIQ
jgi:hypothetical protein